MKTKTLSMSAILLIFLSLGLLTSCGKKEGSKTESGEVGEFNPDKPFHVVFDVKGSAAGTMDAIYSLKHCKITNNMEMHGQKVVSTVYTDGQMVYIVSEAAGMKTGMKMDAKKYAEQSGKNEGQFDISSFKEHLKEYDKSGTEVILGRKCDIYRSRDGKFSMSIYKETLPLKFDFGTMTFIATKIETNVSVSDDTFKPPADVNYIDMEEMMKSTGKTNGNLKNLEEKAKEFEESMKKLKK